MGIETNENETRLRRRMERIGRWIGRFEALTADAFGAADRDFRELLKQWESEKGEKLEALKAEEAALRTSSETATTEYTRKKYQLERDSAGARTDIDRLEAEHQKAKDWYEKESARLAESRASLVTSYEKQKSALQDVFREKRRNLSNARAQLAHQKQVADENLRKGKAKVEAELTGAAAGFHEKIEAMRTQLASKQEGWAIALASMKKEVAALQRDRDDWERRLVDVRDETEEELQSAQTALRLAKEQLEIDKATIVEKAQDDQRVCEKENSVLQEAILSAERELQDFILEKDERLRREEAAFVQEEEALKAAMVAESEKRDYEQRLFEQERVDKEKEINRLREEYEKRKWHWDNQLRALMMKKSVQDAEFDAERIRADREARSELRTLEARRDELRQRLSELKSRFDQLKQHGKRELELREERFRWRKDRVWKLWQTRLETVQKERAVLEEQIEAIVEAFAEERKKMTEETKRNDARVTELQDYILHSGEREAGLRKQREVEKELAKTRLLAQIKECESVILDWKDRVKSVQEESAQNDARFGDEMNFLEKLYRQDEHETELFLDALRRALGALGVEESQRHAA